jgi:hypothetical protein
MVGITVTFADKAASEISEHDKRRVDAALRRVAVGESRGGWRERPSRITVTALLAGGRSGALVLRLEVQRGSQPLSRVAKVSSAADARAEWKAFKDLIDQASSVLCPPIEAVTEGVLDPGLAFTGEDEAVIYNDVRQFAAAATSNLEDLVAAAMAGQPGAVDTAEYVISRLLELAGTVFYNRCQTTAAERDRLEVNHRLGPDLSLVVDGTEAGGPFRRLLPADVLAAALALPGEADELRAGSAVALSGLELRSSGDRLIGRREYIDVELAPGPGQPVPEGPRFSVRGTVTGTRAVLTWERIRGALPEIQVTAAGTMQSEQTQTAHPFAALRQLLNKPVTGLITGTVHGDLNPRNVLIANGEPFLIDYARARADQPILGDFAWLEINLLRYPLSARLSFADLVEVERLLALGDQTTDVLPQAEHEKVGSALAGLAAPHLTGPIRILGAIRRQARLTYARAQSSAGKSAQPGSREYATQLVLASHRTFKWTGDQQTEASLRSAVAAAAVASEQLTCPADPWRLWDRARLAAAAQAVLPLLPDDEAAWPLLASLVRGLGSLAGKELEEQIKHTRARLVRSTPAVSTRRMAELRDGHDLYIDLPATSGTSAVELVAGTARAVVLGASGTGKTALLDELEYRLADSPLGRFEVRIRASDIADALPSGTASVREAGLELLAGQIPVTGRVPVTALLTAGAIHLLVDDFDKIPATARAGVAGWLDGLRQQFPASPVAVCHQGADVPAELDGWTGIWLGEPGDDQIAGYLARFHAARGLTADRAAALITAVSEPGLRELARTPLLLWLLAVTGNEPRPFGTMGKLADAHIRELESRSADSDQWLRWAEALAEWQTGAGENATRDEAFAGPEVAAAWDGAREQLIGLGILAADGPLTRFRLQLYLDYFAARHLTAAAGASPDGLTALALRFSWRDAFALFVSFSPAAPGVLDGLVRAVAAADPGYAGRLLRSAAQAPAELTGWFLAEQERILRDTRAGSVARARAAQAMAEVGRPAAFRRLLAVLGDPAAGSAASELSLIALARAQLAAGPGGRRDRLTAELTVRLGPLLAQAAPPLLVTILGVVGDLELRGLELLVAGHLRRPSSWPVVREARVTLDKLGVLLPAELVQTYQRAQQARLTEVERELPAATSPAQANQLQAERCQLLDARHGPGRLAGLLERRFAFEIGALVAELIDEAAEPVGTGELLAVATGPNPLAAAAAAHRLLRDRPDLAGRLFAALTEDGQADRSLIAAAAAALLPDAELPGVAEYFRRLLASGGSLEGAAVLAGVMYKRDAQGGIRLVRQAHRFLADRRRADRLHWPWARALARFGGTPAELDMLFATDPALAIEALASSAFLIDGGRAPAHRFSDAARERLLGACQEAGRDAGTLLRAAAAMRVPEALDALDALSGPSMADVAAEIDAHTAQALTVAGYGLVEIAPAADALAALGYLGRLGPGAASGVHRLLREFDTSGRHPSVATGRLIGLGYLGDWQPVLHALGSADPRMPAIARHAVEFWVPGPRTPDGYGDPAAVAGWIAGLLAGPDLAPEVRSVLLELKRSAEERAGALTPAPDQAADRHSPGMNLA